MTVELRRDVGLAQKLVEAAEGGIYGAMDDFGQGMTMGNWVVHWERSQENVGHMGATEHVCVCT